MSIPAWAATYASAAIISLVLGFSKRLRNLSYLGLALIALGALGGYAETWRHLKRTNFLWTEIVLLAVFASGYGLLSTKLILGKFAVRTSEAIFASASHTLVASFLVLAYTSYLSRADENPPFTVLVFLSLFCVLHVPMFTAFRNRLLGSREHRQQIGPSTVSSMLWISLVLVAAPVLLASAIAFSSDADWRIALPTFIISGSIWSLILIAR